MEPRIQYAKTEDGVSIAFETLGAGPPLVVTPALLVSHLQLQAQMPVHRTPFEQLNERCTVLRYDPRGAGMSQRDAIDFSVDAALRDLATVADHVSERFALLATVWSGAAPLAFAARHPERVSHVVLWWHAPPSSPPDVGGGVYGDDLDNPRDLVDIAPLIELNWELYTAIRARLVLGWDSPDAAAQTALYRAAHSPASFRAAHDALVSQPLMDYAKDVSTPTLLLHRLDDKRGADLAGRLAANLANATLVGIPGERFSLFPNAIGVAVIDEFILSAHGVAASEIGPSAFDTGVLRTILFTDIEEHTAMMQRLGDAKGREVLREHERVTREALRAHRGAEVKTIGDSFVACFPSAQKALECAIALQQAFESQALQGERVRIRVGLNAGEPIAEADDLFGSSVILAARAKEKAEGGEIVVTDVVRQLVTGKGFLFADRGEVALRGFEDPVRLYEVSWRE